MRAIYSSLDTDGLSAATNTTPLGMNLTLADVPTPTPGPGQVLVKVDYAGINRADTVQAAGHYPPPEGAPSILGLEVAGHVHAIGDGVDNLQVGDKVCSLVKGGAYADFALVPANFAMPIPKDYSLKEAASIVEACVTAYYALVDRLHMQGGETVLIHGGSGAVGAIAIQLARAMELNVLTTAGSPERCQQVERITDCQAIDYHANVVAAVKEATAGRGVDGIIDIVGAKSMADNLRCLARGGRMMVLGMQKGARAEVNLAVLLSKAATIMSGTIRNLPASDFVDLRGRVMRDVWPMLDDKTIVPVIERCFPMEQAAQAHRALLGYELDAQGNKKYCDTPRIFGKILLRVKDN